MKSVIASLVLLASVNTFAVQPRQCEEIESTYNTKYEEFYQLNQARLKLCENLEENASFRCIQKSLNEFDSNIKLLDEQTQRALKFCL